jgi:hypothetical protein
MVRTIQLPVVLSKGIIYTYSSRSDLDCRFYVNNYTNESIWTLPTGPAKPHGTTLPTQGVQGQTQYNGGLPTPAYTPPVQNLNAPAQQSIYTPQLGTSPSQQQSSYTPLVSTAATLPSGQVNSYFPASAGTFLPSVVPTSQNGQTQQNLYTPPTSVSPQLTQYAATDVAVSQSAPQTSYTTPQLNGQYQTQNVASPQVNSYSQQPIASPALVMQTNQLNPQMSGGQPNYNQPTQTQATYIHAPVAQKAPTTMQSVGSPTETYHLAQHFSQPVASPSISQQSSPPPAYTPQTVVQSPQPMMMAPTTQQNPTVAQDQGNVHGQSQVQMVAPQAQQMYLSQINNVSAAPLPYVASIAIAPITQAVGSQMPVSQIHAQPPQMQQGMQQQSGSAAGYYGANGTPQTSNTQITPQGAPQMNSQPGAPIIQQLPPSQVANQQVLVSNPSTAAGGQQKAGEKGLVSDFVGGFTGKAPKNAAGGKKSTGLASTLGAGAGLLLGSMIGIHPNQKRPQHRPVQGAAHRPPRPQGQGLAQRPPRPQGQGAIHGKPAFSAGQAGLVGSMGALALGAFVGNQRMHGQHGGHGMHGAHGVHGGHHNGNGSASGAGDAGDGAVAGAVIGDQTTNYQDPSDPSGYVDQTTYQSSYTDPSTGITQDTYVTDTSYMDSNGNGGDSYSETDVTYDTSGDYDVDTFSSQDDYSGNSGGWDMSSGGDGGGWDMSSDGDW